MQDLQLSHLLTKPIAASLGGLSAGAFAKELRVIVLGVDFSDRRTPANYIAATVGDATGSLPAFFFCELRPLIAEGDILYLTELICKRYRQGVVLYQTKLSRVLVVGRHFLEFSDAAPTLKPAEL